MNTSLEKRRMVQDIIESVEISNEDRHPYDFSTPRQAEKREG